MLKVNWYTFRGSNSYFRFAPDLIRGQFLKERICSELILFERAALFRKGNRKSQKLFNFVKMIENHGEPYFVTTVGNCHLFIYFNSPFRV